MRFKDAVFEFLRRNQIDDDETPEVQAMPAGVPALPAATPKKQPVALERGFAPGPAMVPREDDGPANVIATGTKISGPVESDGSMQVCGVIAGEVSVGDTLSIELGGTIRGDITGIDIYVAGDVVGNIYATGRLTVACSGRVEGDVHARSVAVDEGGVLRGRCHMGRPAMRRKRAPTSDESRPSFLDRIVDDDDTQAAPLAFAPA